MRVVRYRSDEGARTALVVSEGTKLIHLIEVDYPLVCRHLPLTETRYMRDLQDYPVDKARRILRRCAKDWHGGLRNCSQEVRDALRG